MSEELSIEDLNSEVAKSFGFIKRSKMIYCENGELIKKEVYWEVPEEFQKVYKTSKEVPSVPNFLLISKWGLDSISFHGGGIPWCKNKNGS